MNRKPRCIIITGQAGAGKTTLARQLGARLWLPVISSDEIKEGYVNTYGVPHDQLPPDTNGRVSDLFFTFATVYSLFHITHWIAGAKHWPVVLCFLLAIIPSWLVAAIILYIVAFVSDTFKPTQL